MNTQDPLSQLMQKSKLEMPFGDFEETVMHRIRYENSRGQIGLRDRRLSFVFFLSGSLFGLLINFILQKASFTFLNIPAETIVLVFQIGFVLLFLIQLEKNIPLIRQWKKQV